MAELPLTLSATPLTLTLGTEQLVLSLGCQISTGGGAAVVLFDAITEDTSVPAASNGTLYSNTGAASDLVATLPPAVAGLRYGFRVTTGFALGVAPHAGDEIWLDGLTVDDASQLQSSQLAGVVDLECHEAGVWLVTNIRQVWAIEAL